MKFISSKTYLVALTALVVTLYSSLGHSQQQEVTTLYAVNYPPYMIVDSKGAVNGIDVEVTKASFSAVNQPIRIISAPWKRILKSLEFGYIAGALTCSKREDRLSYLNYSDKLSEANQVAVLKENMDDHSINSLSDLNAFKVIAVEGWGIQKELERKKIPHATAQELDDAIRSLIYRDIEVFYSGELTTLYRAKQLNLKEKIKTKRFSDKQSDAFYLCLSKKFEGNEALINKFNEGLKLIKASGEFDQIYRKYL
jgi:polar amino acid transport system substrate-binding protein